MAATIVDLYIDKGADWSVDLDIDETGYTFSGTIAGVTPTFDVIDDDGDATHDNRLIFDKSKGSLYAGTCTGSNWNDANRGSGAIGLGRDVIASGNYSFAIGNNSSITGISGFSGLNISLATLKTSS